MRETGKVLAGQALTFSLQLALMLLAARVLGPLGQGEFAILRTAAYLGESFLWLGLASGLTYLVAKDSARYHDPLLKASLGYLALAIVGIAVGLELVPQGSIGRGGLKVILDHRAALVWWLISLALLQSLQRVFLGQHRFALYNRLNIMNGVVVFPLLLALTHARGVSVAAVVEASILANAMTLAYAIWVHRAQLVPLFHSTSPMLPVMREAYAVGLKGYISAIAFLVLYRLDFFFVAYFLGSQLLGVYTVAVFGIETVQKVPDWLGVILAPQVASGRGADGRLVRRYAAAAIGSVGVLGVLIAGCRRWESGWFRFLLGEGYEGVTAALVLLLPKALLHAVMATYAGYLAGRGYTIYHPLAGVAGLATLCAIDLVAIPRYGLPGAVAGITAAYLVATLVMAWGYVQERRSALAPALGS